MTSHVLLPHAATLQIGFKSYSTGIWLREVMMGRWGEGNEVVQPGLHAIDGSYTDVRVSWMDWAMRIESGHDSEGHLVLLITPEKEPVKPTAVTLECGLLWNAPGHVTLDGNTLTLESPHGKVLFFATHPTSPDPYCTTLTPTLTFQTREPFGISAQRQRTCAEIRQILDQRRQDFCTRAASHGELAEAWKAMQSCLAWNTIYDPGKQRVICPVSRRWSALSWGGYILFDWDTFFAGMMAAIDNYPLACANVLSILEEVTEDGFVPNYSAATGSASRDRSQPPVGSLAVMEIYRRHRDPSLLEAAFEPLLRWNRWWPRRRDIQGWIGAGSNPYTPVTGNEWEYPQRGVGQHFGAVLETGADNSPMYEGIPFDEQTHLLLLADVGQTSLYVADCDHLAAMATLLQRHEEAAELHARAEQYRERLKALWDEEASIFACKRLDTQTFVKRHSPVCFYPLLARAASPQQAQTMVERHLMNPAAFGGSWMLPSISRQDSAYPEQDYWRGSIWPPHNLLAYLSLRAYDLPKARAALAHSSHQMLLQEWQRQGWVCENYHGDTGRRGVNSDPFYHWGGLMGLLAFYEKDTLKASAAARP